MQTSPIFISGQCFYQPYFAPTSRFDYIKERKSVSTSSSMSTTSRTRAHDQ